MPGNFADPAFKKTLSYGKSQKCTKQNSIINFHIPITQLQQLPILRHPPSPAQLSLFYTCFLRKVKFAQNLHSTNLCGTNLTSGVIYFTQASLMIQNFFYLQVSLCSCLISLLPHGNHCSDIFKILDQVSCSRSSYKWSHTVCAHRCPAFSHRIMSVRFLHIVSFISSFFNIAEQYCIAGINRKLFIHSPTDGHLFGLFLFGVIMNKTTMNTFVQCFTGLCLNVYLIHPRCKISGLPHYFLPGWLRCSPSCHACRLVSAPKSGHQAIYFFPKQNSIHFKIYLGNTGGLPLSSEQSQACLAWHSRTLTTPSQLPFPMLISCTSAALWEPTTQSRRSQALVGLS